MINEANNSNYDFDVPTISADAGKSVRTVFPTSSADEVTLTANAATVTTTRQCQVLALGELAADSTITLAPVSAELNVGALVILTWTSPAGAAKDVAVKVGATTVASKEGSAGARSNLLLVWKGDGYLQLN